MALLPTVKNIPSLSPNDRGVEVREKGVHLVPATRLRSLREDLLISPLPKSIPFAAFIEENSAQVHPVTLLQNWGINRPKQVVKRLRW